MEYSAAQSHEELPMNGDTHVPSEKTATRIMLSLPEIHCAGCIAGVERLLNAMPNVQDARVNLTLKRATVDAVV